MNLSIDFYFGIFTGAALASIIIAAVYQHFKDTYPEDEHDDALESQLTWQKPIQHDKQTATVYIKPVIQITRPPKLKDLE